MIIGFAGHSFVPFFDEVKAIVKEKIRGYISNDKKLLFYLGGYGDFDEICAVACKELKQEFDFIERLYVAPYIDLREQEKIKEMLNLGLCDGSLYPPIENVPKRFAISRRNEWIISNADIVIAYVKQDYGGAYNALKYAKRKKKTIINIFDFV